MPKPAASAEERLVAELELLGLGYLSRQTSYQARRVRRPAALLADLVRQPSARVRASVIAVLLAHPEFADQVPVALDRLGPEERLTLQSFYAAAMLLQQEHATRLRPWLAARWQWLPELHQVTAELRLPAEGSPRERLSALGREHRRRLEVVVNWVGTYEHVTEQLIRHWEVRSRWNR